MQSSRLDRCRWHNSLWAWALIGALLAVQALGFWHRVVHTDHAKAQSAWSQQTPIPTPFDEHLEDGSDCRVFDALTTAALGVLALALLFGLHRMGAAQILAPQPWGCVGLHAHHAQARAPPRAFSAR